MRLYLCTFLAVCMTFLLPSHCVAASPTALLVEAVGRNDLAAAKLALASGADANAQDNAGRPVLVAAASVSRFEMMRLLLKSGAKPNAEGAAGTAALLVVSGGQDAPAILGLLVAKGADVNEKSSGGQTALASASFWGLLENVRFLLTHGAHATERDAQGRTVLQLAVAGARIYGRPTGKPSPWSEIITLLKAHGAKE